ncbi:SVP1-like protein 2 [Podospora fimiseda]|uniref:SVP1-like protein 2 n=1 Tax=Podospora fimiseda TaxID=252190 RepID=A0AAN7BTR5_9PEZI|nr:SVP1-like protein 2 [Podospora fimiseda]
MNTRPPLETSRLPRVLSVTFNDDCSCFAVGLETGFSVFNTETCTRRTVREFNAGIGLVQMMGKANYLGLVGGGRNPKYSGTKLVVWDEVKSKEALEITALSVVRGALLSKERIVLVLQNSVRIFKFAKQPNLLHAYETANNLNGICAMSARRIAFPGRTAGHVQIVELATNNVSIIPAHSSSVRAIQFSPDGELIATASDTGTLIRVWNASNCARVAELRRGVDHARIFSLAFSPSGTMLACTSDKATLHVFDVPHPRKPAARQHTATNGGPAATDSNDGKGKWGVLSKLPLMPRVFSDTYSFASAPFEAGDEPLQAQGTPVAPEAMTLGTSRPTKGLLGWLTESTLVVIGAGKDARWEKFVIHEGSDGRRNVTREGWRRYLGDL